MAVISDVMRGPFGDIQPNVVITMRAKATSAKVLVSNSSSTATDANGKYSMTVSPGEYTVNVSTLGDVGDIKVLPDSANGTLNDFLIVPTEDELTPEIVNTVNTYRTEAAQSAAAAKGSEKKVAEAIKKMGEGGIKRLPATTDLNTVMTAGIYIVPGGVTTQGSYNMNYPYGVGAGSEIQLSVSVDSRGAVTQSLLASLNEAEPGPWVRVRSNGGWNRWSRPLDLNTFDAVGVQQKNFNQAGLNVHKPATGVSTIWYYEAPDGTKNKPNPKTTPTNNEGIVISLKNPSARPMQGVFGGVVIAVDKDGRAFTNVDKKNPGTADLPSDLDWRELASVRVKNLQSIPDATAATQVETLNKILAVMREAGLLKKA
ncbi:prophage tail fiber N-terminal domain-containing protein [Serratia aquatilis]|uniref:Prophage tail fiber N-terminal domain-containing protein n=1 Tax=Serratia aquatilis TaxID=1737515 RepID=A0ABV6E9K0_9GAMM